MNTKEPLAYDRYFHIYNRGINSSKIFQNESDYLLFLKLYLKYSRSVFETIAWVLIPNHFHLLVRVKSENEIPNFEVSQRNKDSFSKKEEKIVPSVQIGHFFNAFTRSYNYKYKRTGALFEKPFKRIKIENDSYFKYLIYYIHNNPVHHGILSNLMEYRWSSYKSIISNEPSNISRNTTLAFFNSRKAFVDFHNRGQDIDEVKDFLLE